MENQMECKLEELCQSCTYPLTNEEEFGTNADGSKNEEYCKYCYADGQFTDPNITVDQMIEKVISILSQEMMPAEQAKAMAEQTIPALKRWR